MKSAPLHDPQKITWKIKNMQRMKYKGTLIVKWFNDRFYPLT